VVAREFVRGDASFNADVSDLVDVEELRGEIRDKYRDVARSPATADLHFHVGRAHALRLGYPQSALDRLPDEACEAFAGVGNPFYWEIPNAGERVVDLGSGAGMDSLLAGHWAGSEGKVVGVDMTFEMIERARKTAHAIGLDNVEFRPGVIEDLPVESGWADVVISNGVINLCPDKFRVYKEVYRVLKPGGRMMIADICVEKPVSDGALKDIDLWTG
jgi:SAM-dependent methyltransferase